MRKTSEESSRERTMGAGRDLSSHVARNLDLLAKEWTEASAEFWSGALRTSTNTALRVSKSLTGISSGRQTDPPNGESDLVRLFTNRLDDAVKTVEVLTRSVTESVEESTSYGERVLKRGRRPRPYNRHREGTIAE